jgi:hypothetical protein
LYTSRAFSQTFFSLGPKGFALPAAANLNDYELISPESAEPDFVSFLELIASLIIVTQEV